jgi:hypothetical protein
MPAPQAALIYQHATSDRDRAIADALSDMATGAPVVPIRRGRDLSPRTLGHVQVTPASETSAKDALQAPDQDFSAHPQRGAAQMGTHATSCFAPSSDRSSVVRAA